MFNALAFSVLVLLPPSAACAAEDGSQDMGNFLGSECTLLGHEKLLTNQHSQILLCGEVHSPQNLYLCLGLPRPRCWTLLLQ